MQRCRLEIVHYPDQPDPQSIEKFRSFLGDCKVDPEPSLAAPGTSDHGRMEAIDFVVMKDGKKIADTVTANIGLDWDGPGWTMKLKKAVIESKATFDHHYLDKNGLREPWHYRLR
jgi:hypothetical protein